MVLISIGLHVFAVLSKEVVGQFDKRVKGRDELQRRIDQSIPDINLNNPRGGHAEVQWCQPAEIYGKSAAKVNLLLKIYNLNAICLILFTVSNIWR